MKVTAVRAKNFMGIREVEIHPGERSLILIAGANEAGKTSVLRILATALGGARESPDEPIRQGAKRGKVEVILDNGDMIVERTFTKKGTQLKVRGAKGTKRSPQALLDKLLGGSFLDPVEFQRKSARDQRTTLLGLLDLDIDLDALATKRQTAYDRRRDLGRDIKRLEAELEGIGVVGTLPERCVKNSAISPTSGKKWSRASPNCRLHRMTGS